jgi:hypothetical protein
MSFSHGETATPLTKKERETDMSYYETLASRRNANSTASVDGKIHEPHLNDVLCGRGGSINAHHGNVVFRGWIAERKDSYNLADSKADKSKITASILRKVRAQSPPGRFLQKVVEGNSRGIDHYSIGGWWAEVDDQKALAKISQALREGAPAFRALHSKKRPKKRKDTPQRSSTRRNKQKNKGLPPKNEKRKAPPRTKAAPAETKEKLASIPQPMALENDGRSLDVLFPTTNNVFEVAASSSGDLLDSYPLVHMGDYTASMDEVARAIPTPPAFKKQTATVTADAKPPGKATTPCFGPAPNTPLVSPGFSPFNYGEAQSAWDAISFLPNLSPTAPRNHSPLRKKSSLQRSHSLSFSDCEVHSVGSFDNPFEDNHGIHNSNHFPRPLPELHSESGTPHGLSFGKIGSLPGGPLHRKSTHNETEHSFSSKSVASKSSASISNFHNNKRKSIG